MKKIIQVPLEEVAEYYCDVHPEKKAITFNTVALLERMSFSKIRSLGGDTPSGDGWTNGSIKTIHFCEECTKTLISSLDKTKNVLQVRS